MGYLGVAVALIEYQADGFAFEIQNKGAVRLARQTPSEAPILT
jgi:hypothetical protein